VIQAVSIVSRQVRIDAQQKLSDGTAPEVILAATLFECLRGIPLAIHAVAVRQERLQGEASVQAGLLLNVVVAQGLQEARQIVGVSDGVSDESDVVVHRNSGDTDRRGNKQER
jgi:hypothetical protein